MLREVGWRVRLEGERVSGEGEEEEETSKKEINRVVRKLKDGKSARRDGIVNEMWKYAGEMVRKWL